MLKILKNNKFITAASLLISTSVAAVIVSSIAWFTNVNSFNPNNVVSSVITSYFDSGSGTLNDPFVITRPIHYWNLVYLQENNQMEVTVNGTTTTFANASLYFQFGKKNADGYTGTDDDDNDLFYEYDNAGFLQYASDDVESTSPYLNMNYYQGSSAILPLGTSAHPFLGHIIGNNLTVSNLHINGGGLCDVGIFGYVENGATVSNLYFESPYIDTGTTNPSATSASTHTAHTTHTYIGYIAGHVYNASTAFSNVYVNNCQLLNSTGNANEMINTYGYFGHVDYPSTITADSASYATEMNAGAAYGAINDSYSGASSSSVAARHTSYTPSGSYSSAVVNNTGSYSMGSYNSNPYSLSTIGYASGDTVTEYLRYFDTNDNNELKKISTGTVELDAKPTSWSSYADGYYLYWDSTNNKWQYTTVVSPVNPEPTQVNYNCITISYTYNSTTYYCKYSSGSLVSTTVTPSDAGTELNNYYFVLKASAGSTGVATLTSTDDPADYYIYSPQNQKYMTATATSDGAAPTFVDSTSSALMFTVEGPQSAITYTNSDTGCLMGESTVYGRKTVATVNATIFNLGTVQSRYTDEGAVYDKITALSQITDGDTLAIGAVKSNAPEGYTTGAMSTTQNANNRGTVFTSIDADNRLVSVSNLAKLTVNIDATSHYTFYDPANSGYLYAAGTASTSRNYLRTAADPTTYGNGNWGFWNITLDSDDYEAHIINVGNASTPYLRYNASSNGTAYYTFSCYGNESVSTTVTPFLFKRNATSGTIQYYSNAVVITFTSQSSDEKVVTNFDLHTAPNTVTNPENASYYSTDAFAVQRTASITVTFNKTLSKVSYTAQAINRWQKITTASELTAGIEIIMLHEGDSNALAIMSTMQNDNNRGIIAGTNVTGTPNYIENANLPATAQVITLETGVTSTYWAFNVGSSYLYAASSSSNYLRTQTTKNSYSDASIIISGGDATITFQGSYTHNLLCYNNTSSIFSCYATVQKTVQIYKHIVSSNDTATYIGDLVGNRYDPDRIDVVGPATYYPSYVEMSGSIDSSYTFTNSDIGNNFYTTTYAKNAITIMVDVTGSRDLGTLFYTYTASSSAIPEFATGNASNPISLVSAGARDVDSNSGDSVHTYLLNLNTSNIAALSLCALDSSGKICTVYDNTGAVAYTNNTAIAKYVIEIGSTAGTIQISDVQFTYNRATGNVGNFGSVDYRSATYDSTTGAFTGAANQVTSSFISIYYSVSTSGQTVSITVSYDSATKTYNVTITSSVSMTVNIFNYDANTYSLVVNGTAYTYGTNTITVAAT